MLSFIDNWLFDKVYQPVSDWMTNRYHRTCFWIAALCGGGTFLLDILQFGLAKSHTLFGYLFMGILTLFWLYLIELMAKKEQDAQNSSLKATANPWRVEMVFTRTLFLMLTVLMLPSDVLAVFRPEGNLLDEVVELVRPILFLSFCYFASCNVWPPRRVETPVEETDTVPQNT